MVETRKTAVISECGAYRYALGRGWSDIFGERDDVPFANFIMLNPSTADSTIDDPTIRRCIGFARSWGLDALRVTNLYACRATDPADLWRAADPIGPDNDHHVFGNALDAEVVVCAWGIHGARDGRGAAVAGRLCERGIRLSCLGLTKDGHPRHPLYLAADSDLTPYVRDRASAAR